MKRSIITKSLRALAGIGIVVLFVSALIVSARIGTEAALRRLPEGMPDRAADRDYPIGELVVVGGDGEPVFLSRSVQALRNFFFSHPEPASRRAAETEAMDLRRFVGEIEVRTLAQDADLMRVEVQSGALNGDIYWIHLSQLPRPEAAENGAPVSP